MKRFLRDESGMAMITVIGVAAIVLLLFATLMVLTNYRTMQSAKYVKRITAVQLADAGLNTYLYQLSIKYDYPTTTPTIGPHTTSEGSWIASASASTTSNIITVRSTGTALDGSKKTVVAQCYPPSFSEYVTFADGAITVGNQSIIHGKIRANGNLSVTTGGLTNNPKTGYIEGQALYSGTASPVKNNAPDPAYFTGGSAKVQAYPFSSVSAEIANFKGVTVAPYNLVNSRSDGLTTKSLGYQITLRGNVMDVKRVVSVNTTEYANWGKIVVDPRTTTQMIGLAIPANGRIIVNGDNVWVSGTYTSAVTVVATASSAGNTTYGNIYISDSIILGSGTTDKVTCGLIAENSVWIPAWSSKFNAAKTTGAMSADLTIQAALLAQNGACTTPAVPSLTPTNQTAYTHTLLITGALASHNTPSWDSHITTRNYWYDPRLMNNPPPGYPKTGGVITIASWLEN